MSTQQDDRKVLDGRKPLKYDGIEASLRDQIPAKLKAKLVERNYGATINKIVLAGDAKRQQWLLRQQEFLDTWDELLNIPDEGPFAGSSNLHIPMPLIVSRAMHARFLQALLGTDPPFNLKARTEASLDRTELVSDTLAYTLKDWANNYRGIEHVIDTWLWHWVTTGCGILKIRWDCLYESFVDVVEAEKEDVPQFTVDEQGNEQLIPRKKLVEEEQTITKKIFEGPVFQTIDPEDLLIIGGDGDPQLADSVHHSDYLTASQLWTLVDRKVFDAEDVEEIIRSGPDLVSGEVEGNIKQQRAYNAGENQLDTEADLDRYKIVESYVSLDVTNSGINSQIVIWTHPRTGRICRATYLRRVNKSGERPFFKIDFHKRTGATYGVGMPELMYPISKEIDAIHNIRVDNGILANMPVGFYKATSSMEPAKINLEPGQLIPLDSPQTDVYFPPRPNSTAFGYQEEAGLMSLLERLTGVNDMTMGVMSGAQGATRTATGAQALLGESNANLDIFLRRMNMGWRQALRFTVHMLQQRLPEGLSFRVTGQDGNEYWRQIKSAQEIAGDFDIEVSNNSAHSNKMIQQQTAAQVLQLVSNPLYVQLGICGPGQIFEALKTQIKSLGVKEWNRYIQAPQGYSLQLTPMEELNRLARGVDVPVTPNMDHEGYLQAYQMILKDDALLGQFDTQAALRLARQAKLHEQMLAALQQQQAQVAEAAQNQMAMVAPAGQLPQQALQSPIPEPGGAA